MKPSRSIVIFALGFFALAAQVVLFRGFLTAFEGSELGVGCFYGAWLTWVAVGAIAGRANSRVHARVLDRFELAVLAYLPAFGVQQFLISHSRTLAAVEAYELFPIEKMAALSFVVNAPVSLATGFLFTMACRWSVGGAALPVARVYVLETFGACVGGASVTAALVVGVSSQSVFLGAAAVLTLGLLGAAERPIVRYGPALLCALALALGWGDAWTRYQQVDRWTRLLPAENYQGSFTTAQGVYLYGTRERQFVVVSGSGVSEVFPGGEHAAEVAALHLAQKPNAKRVLVVGSEGLGLCAAFSSLPQMEHAVWLHYDAEFAQAFVRALPSGLSPPLERIEIPAAEVRAWLRTTPERFDLVLLSLPDVTTLVLNRYCTAEFFALAKSALAPGGVLSVRISGAANFVSGEMAYLGGSMLATIESVFANVVLKPGSETWLIASDGADLSTHARKLGERFSAIEGAARLYPPQNISALFPADRVVFQRDAYSRAIETAGKNVLVNTDAHPKALLFSLLAGLRRAGWGSLTDDLPIVLHVGLGILLCPILLYASLRAVYLIGAKRFVHRLSTFDGQFLVFSSGLIAMSLAIVMMFLYQVQFGSLFLHAGLIAAFFMLGSWFGSMTTERLLARGNREPAWLLPALIGALAALCAVTGVLPQIPVRAAFALLFLLCGACTGACFPLGAYRLQAAGKGAAASGAALEVADHAGGALGGAATGLFLIPMFGANAVLGLLAVVAASNIVHVLVRRDAARRGDWFDRAVRPAGYAMAGIALFFVAASNLAASAAGGRVEARVLAAAKTLAPGTELEARQATLPEGGVFTYYESRAPSGEIAGYIWNTAAIAKNVRGYGGPIVMAAYAEPNGVLRGFRIVDSRETPAYLDRLGLWTQRLFGRNLFAPAPFANVDAVSGATMTSRAILRALEESSRAFASIVLGRSGVNVPRSAAAPFPDRETICLAALLSAAVFVRYVPRKWVRRLFLTITVAVGGVWLNAQYAMQQTAALLSGHCIEMGLTGVLFLSVGVPLFVAIFGNVYCGYVCPFGALQELVGDLSPTRLWMPAPRKTVWRYARAVKYGLLVIFIVLFFLTRDYAVLRADPLIAVFSPTRGAATAACAAALLLLSLRYRRFWCRNLCPAGAFLSVLSGIALARKWIPQTRPAHCDQGVRRTNELDCLHCDRCRHETK